MICNQRLPWAEVVEIRREYDAGEITLNQLRKKHNISLVHCDAIVHGGSRQIEHTRKPKLSTPSTGRIEHPSGVTFRKRGVRMGPRFMRQIEFKTIVLMRHAYDELGMRPLDIAVLYGVSLSHTMRILKRKARISE